MKAYFKIYSLIYLQFLYKLCKCTTTCVLLFCFLSCSSFHPFLSLAIL